MPFAETFTIVTRTVSGRDGDGNDVYSTLSTSTRGAFAPAGSSELVQGVATVLTHDTLYLEPGAPVPGPHDHVIARGVERYVDGTPEVYRSPFTGRTFGAVVHLTEVTG